MPTPIALLAAARTPFAPPGQLPADRLALAKSAIHAAIGRAGLATGAPSALLLAYDQADAGLTKAIAQHSGLSAMNGCTGGMAALIRAWQALQSGQHSCLVLAGLASEAPRTAAAAPEHFAACSAQAQRAIDDGHFSWEIVPLLSEGALVNRDTLPTSPGPVAGAAALVLGRQPGNNTLARIVALVEQATTDTIGAAAADACQATLAAAGWAADMVELWALDERQVGLADSVQERFALPDSRINPDGGNLAFGDAGPADALRQLIGLLGALRRQGLRRGLLCVGDGEEAVLALAVEFEARIACGGRVPGSIPTGA